jgi:hypothetical protein
MYLTVGHFTQPSPDLTEYLKANRLPVLSSISSEGLPFLLGAVPVVLLALVLGIGIVRYGSRLTLQMVGLMGVLVLGIWTVHTMFNLNYLGAASPYEYMVERATSADVRELTRDVQAAQDDLLLQRKNRQIAVEEARQLPLAWYLRPWQVTYSRKVTSGPALAIVDVRNPAPQGPYTGQRYRLTSSWNPQDLDLGKWWRWFVYREVKGKLENRDVVLYVRRQ